MPFRPKDALREAKLAEKSGNNREASAIYARLSAYLRKRKKPKEALSLIERAISLVSDAPRLYLQKALCDFQNGNEEAARSSMMKFIQLTVQKGKGDTYRAYMEAECAEVPVLRVFYYESIFKVDRTEPRMLLNLAHAQMDSGNFKGAKASLMQAVEAKVIGQELVELLRITLGKLGESFLDEAVDSFDRGDMKVSDFLLLLQTAKPGPNLHETVESPVPTFRGLNEMIKDLEEKLGVPLEEKHDNVAPLIEEFRRRADPILGVDSKGRSDMALAFLEMGLYEEARAELLNIPNSDPNYLESRIIMGEILMREGRNLEALEVFHESLRDSRVLPPMWCELTYKVIQVYFRLGDYTKCADEIRRLEKKEPRYRDIRELKRQLPSKGAAAGK